MGLAFTQSRRPFAVLPDATEYPPGTASLEFKRLRAGTSHRADGRLVEPSPIVSNSGRRADSTLALNELQHPCS